MRKKPKRQPKVDSGARLLQDVVEAQISALKHGGLTYAAGRMNISVSHMRKKLHSPKGAFCPVTCRAVLHVLATRSDKFTGQTPIRTETVGRFQIDLYDTPEGTVPAWKPTP